MYESREYLHAQHIFIELIRMFAAGGIPVPVTKIDRTLKLSRSSTRLGTCRKEKGIYRISISEYILEDEETVRNTLAHELVHTCRGCMNHGVTFQRIGQLVEKTFGIEVNRTATREESERSGIREAYENKARYRIICRRCGAVFYRQKRSKLVTHPGNYRCGKCGGILRVEEV